MRGSILLGLAIVVVLSLLYWSVDRFYLVPLATADQRIADLTGQLAALRERENLARTEQTSFGGGGPASASSLVERSPDSGAASSQLQEYARAAVAQSDGLAASSQVMVSEIGGGYSKVSVLLRLRIGEPQLLEFLRKVETRSPPVMFDSLEVRLVPTSPDSRPLDVTATLSGFHGNADAR